jgi:hypothetical protein
MYKIGALLILFVGAAAPASASCPPPEVSFMFINGINTLEPAESAIKLAEVLSEGLSPPELCNVNVEVAENKSYGLIADLCESAIQLGIVDNTKECSDAAEALRPGFGSAVADLGETLAALDGTSIADVSIEHAATFNGILKKFQFRLRENPINRIVVVSHSQGNLYANEVLSRLVKEVGGVALERVSIVSVATPAPDVFGGGDPRPYVTLREDPIYKIRNALPYNTESARNCGFPWECHSFAGSYLVDANAKEAILLNARLATLTSHPTISDTTPVEPHSLSKDQVLRINGTDILSVVFPGTSVLVLLPDRTVVRLSGTQLVATTEEHVDARVTLAWPGQYSVQVIGNSSLRSNVLPFVVLPEASVAPTAGFSIMVPSQLVLSPGTLTVAADSASSEARITFDDRSTDSDPGDSVVGWIWKVDTRTDPLCTGTPKCSWGFSPGHYTITLTVTDTAGHLSEAHGYLVVEAPPPTITDVAPHTVIAFSADQSITLTGARFEEGLTFSVGLPGGGTALLSGSQLRRVSATSVEALVTFADSGMYTFIARNPDGAVSPPFSMTAVSSPPVVFDGTKFPQLVNHAFGKPVSDSRGNLIAVNFNPDNICGGGFCVAFTVISIDPVAGEINWEAKEGSNPNIHYVGSDYFATWGLAVGVHDEIFVQSGRQEMLAYSEGQKLPGWPYIMGTELAIDSRFTPGLTVSPITGDVFAAVSPMQTFCCQPLPTFAGAVDANGTQRLLVRGDRGGQWLLGPGDDPYLIYNTRFAGGIDNDFTRYDAVTLEPVCSGRSPGSLSLGSPRVLFGSSYGALYTVDGACQSHLVVNLPAVMFGPMDVSTDHVIGSLVPNWGVDGHLAGVSILDGSFWQHTDISPTASVSTQNVTYVLGFDRADGLKQKLFVLNGLTGNISQAIETAPLCAACSVTSAKDGSVYLTDTASTKIYRLR